jgi:hypothetical protein
MAQINSIGYTPNAMTLKVLENAGLIKKSIPAPTAGGGYGYNRRKRRRGGGGGSVVQAPKVTGPAPVPTDSLPAFAGGSGMNGLINWRL